MSVQLVAPPRPQRSRNWSWRWCGRGCTPAPPTRHRPTGARPTCTAKDWYRSPALAHRGSRSSHLPTWPPRSDISHDAARQLIADALELACRLPRLWDLVQAGAVPAWRARLIARETTDLSVEAALFADRLIAATPTRIGQVHAARLVQEARLYFDPDRAIADEEEALAKRGVWLRHTGAPATTDVTMTLDTPDALLFDQTIGRLAADLKEFGDTETLDVRRAHAVGILADPQHALDLMSGREDVSPSPHGGAANLYLHLTPEDLAADLTGRSGAASIEKLGAATTTLLTDWLTRIAQTGAKITLRPVLDLNSDWAVDQHDPPETMRETVILRDAHCVFPGCRRDSRACDLDHITEYLPHGRRRTTRPNPARKPRPPVPNPPPHQDPLHLGLQTPRRRPLHLDQPHRPSARRHPDPSTDPKNLTAHHPGFPTTGKQWFRDARWRSLLNHRESAAGLF